MRYLVLMALLLAGCATDRFMQMETSGCKKDGHPDDPTTCVYAFPPRQEGL